MESNCFNYGRQNAGISGKLPRSLAVYESFSVPRTDLNGNGSLSPETKTKFLFSSSFHRKM